MANRLKSLKILLVLFAIFFVACIDSRPPKITKVMDGQISIPARQGFINDYAGIIHDSTKQTLESELLAFKRKANVEFVVVIVDSKDGYSINDHSMAIVREWCLDCRSGSAGEILIDVVMEDGEFRWNVSKPLWDVLPDDELDRLRLSLEEFFSRGEYSDGLSEIVREVTNRVLSRHERTNSNA